MTRDTPEGEIAPWYDPMLWRDLDHKLRALRLEWVLRIATMNAPHEVMRHQQGILRGLDMVREMANELMRNRSEES